MSDTFTPPYFLRNPHLQTVLASLRPKKYCIEKYCIEKYWIGGKAGYLLRVAKEQILDCGKGGSPARFLQLPSGKGKYCRAHPWVGGQYRLQLSPLRRRDVI